MEVYTFTPSDIENLADVTKISVIRALVSEGLLEEDVAERWTKDHTLVLRKKSLFRTLSGKWKDQEEAKGFYITCVKSVESFVDDVNS